MSHNSDMIKLVKLLEGKNKFAGEEVGQKPGDQVRGTDRAEVDGTDHPFKGRLVGEDTTLEDVLSKKYQDFKDVQAKEKEEKRKEKLDDKDELDESNDPQSRKLGRIIGRIYNEIYDMGDDALDYLNDRAPVWAELWDRYEGDIDSIIAEEDPVTLGKAALELKDILNDLQSDQGVAEGDMYGDQEVSWEKGGRRAPTGAFRAPALSAANAAAEYQRSAGGYRGRVDVNVGSREEYMSALKALQNAAQQAGLRIEVGRVGDKMSVFSDSTGSDELGQFVDNTLQQGVAEGSKKIPASNKPVDPKDLVVSLKDVPVKKPRGHKQYDPANEFPGIKAFKKQGVAEVSDENPHTSALGKALYRDLSKEKKASPAQVERNKLRWAQRQKAKAEQPPTKSMSNAEKVDKGWRNPNIDEVSDATLTSYLTKVDADSQKHEKDPTKRSAEKRNKSVSGFSRAFNKLDARKGVKEGAYEDGVSDGIRGVPNRRASSIYGPETGQYEKGYAAGLQQGKEQQQSRLAQAKADEAPYEDMSNDELIRLRKEIQQRTTERQKIYSKLRGSDYSFDFKRHTPPNHKELKQQGEADNKAWHIINHVLHRRGVNIDRLGESFNEASNPTDKVTMDVPLMIRLFEYAREDAQTDMDLHNVSERLIKLSSEGRVLTMQDYDTIVSGVNEAAPALVRGAAGLALGGVAAAGTVPLMGIFGPVLGMGIGAVGSYKAAQWGMQGADAIWDKVASLFGGEKPAENFAMLHAQAAVRGDKTFEFGGKEYPVTIRRDQAKPAVQAVKAAVQESQRGAGQVVNELGADGSALGSVAAAKSQQAALSTKPDPVNPDGKAPAAPSAGAPAAKPVSPTTQPGQEELTPDEQDALDKIKANAGLKSQYDRLLKQAQSGV